MKRRSLFSSVVVIVILVAMLTGCNAASTADTAVESDSQEATESQAAQADVSDDTSEGDDSVQGRYNLSTDTGFDIMIYGGSWDDWFVNAPSIYEYKVEAPYKIGFITGWRGNPWQEVCIAEFEREVGRSTLIEEYMHLDSAGDVDTQIANLEGMFTMWQNGELDGIIVDPLDPVALNATITKIYEAGCPIILFNNAVDSTEYTSLITDDPVAYGKNDAQWLVDQLDGEGDILFFRGLQGYPIDEGRGGGAEAVFAQYPGINIIAMEYAEWSADVAKSKFFDMVAAHPDFDAIYSEGGQMSLAIIDGMLELGMDPSLYPHASEDQNGFLKKCLEYDIPACASCHPSINSAIAVHVMEMLLQGYPVPKLYYYSTPFISDVDFETYVRPDAPDGIFVFTPLDDATLNSIIK